MLRENQYELEEIGRVDVPSASGTAPLSKFPTPSRTEAADEILHGSAAIYLLLNLTLLNAMPSVTTGFTTISSPTMAKDTGLAPQLTFWPVLVYPLATGTLLLPAGAIADIVGDRKLCLVGGLLGGVFAIACGLARTGPQLIAFRACQGVAYALFTPASISVVSKSIAPGRTRNIGFSCLGLSMALGFLAGLLLGGVFASTVGWRVGWYLFGGLTLLFSVSGIYTIGYREEREDKLKRLKELDWTGVAIITAGIGLLSYVLAMLSISTAYVKQPANIALLITSFILLISFPLWESRMERRKRPALIPNSLWKHTPFVTVCLMLTCSYAVMQAMELLVSLFYQNVQHLSEVDSSIRFIPSQLMGCVAQLSTGLLIDKLSARWVLLCTTFLSAGSPLLMALVDPAAPYWDYELVAQMLWPLSCDVIFTIGLLVVADSFPARTQALAGAVFNTVGMFGQALGLAVIAVIANSVARSEAPPHARLGARALESGYKAGFWASFASMLVAAAVGALGLRKIGRVGWAPKMA